MKVVGSCGLFLFVLFLVNLWQSWNYVTKHYNVQNYWNHKWKQKFSIVRVGEALWRSLCSSIQSTLNIRYPHKWKMFLKLLIYSFFSNFMVWMRYYGRKQEADTQTKRHTLYPTLFLLISSLDRLELRDFSLEKLANTIPYYMNSSIKTFGKLSGMKT